MSPPAVRNNQLECLHILIRIPFSRMIKPSVKMWRNEIVRLIKTHKTQHTHTHPRINTTTKPRHIPKQHTAAAAASRRLHYTTFCAAIAWFACKLKHQWKEPQVRYPKSVPNPIPKAKQNPNPNIKTRTPHHNTNTLLALAFWGSHIYSSRRPEKAKTTYTTTHKTHCAPHGWLWWSSSLKGAHSHTTHTHIHLATHIRRAPPSWPIKPPNE